MSHRLLSIFSLRRLWAEALARIDYRKYQDRYWELRSSDLLKRYRYENDFPVLEGIIRTSGARHVLDIGCGYGRLFDLYRRMNVREVIGLEFSDVLFVTAKKKADEIGDRGGTRFLIKKQILRQPLQDVPAVDLIVSCRVLQHFHPDDILTLAQRLAQTGAKSIYLNELLDGRQVAPYLFVHDYIHLFSNFGFRVSAHGKVPILEHEYLFLER